MGFHTVDLGPPRDSFTDKTSSTPPRSLDGIQKLLGAPYRETMNDHMDPSAALRRSGFQKERPLLTPARYASLRNKSFALLRPKDSKFNDSYRLSLRPAGFRCRCFFPATGEPGSPAQAT